MALSRERAGPWASARRVLRIDGLLALVALWLGIVAWIRPLSSPDEGRYVGVAWEMLRGDSWLVPTLDGFPFLHKPPLFYWLSALSMQTFGAFPWAARLPSWLAASGAACALFVFLKRWSGSRAATAGLVILVSCPGWFGGAQFANHDMLVAACISAAILLAAHAFLSRERGEPYRAALLGGFACAALGVLTKGLIGVVLPVLVLSIWAVVSGRRASLALLLRPAGLVLFAAIVMPWFVAMQTRYPGFFDYAFLHQQLDRFATRSFNNVRPWWFYVPVIVGLGLPWTAWSMARLRLPRRAAAVSTDAALRSLWWTWLAVVLVFFSIPNSKLVGYALPALPALAALVGDAWRRAAPARSPKALARLAGLAAVICVAGTAIMVASDHKSSRGLAAAMKGRIHPDDRIVMLDRYVYDAGFYLRSSVHPIVVASWHGAAALSGDGWQRELADAASFAAPADRERLVETTAALAMLCSSTQRTWIFADPDAPGRFAWLSQTRLVYSSERLAAWEFDRNADSGVCAPDGLIAIPTPDAG